MIKKRTYRLLITYVAAGVLFACFSPTKLPALFLWLPFVLLFLCVYFSAQAVYGYKLHTTGNPGKFHIKMGAVSAFPIVLLLLESIGQMSEWSFLMVTTLFGGVCFYFVNVASVSSRSHD